MQSLKTCSKCKHELEMKEFSWRDAAHTRHQSICKSCVRKELKRLRAQNKGDGFEHLRNHFETTETICGKNAQSTQISSHYFDQKPKSSNPVCQRCVEFDEAACLEAEYAKKLPRKAFDSDPYRETYLRELSNLRGISHGEK